MRRLVLVLGIATLVVAASLPAGTSARAVTCSAPPQITAFTLDTVGETASSNQLAVHFSVSFQAYGGTWSFHAADSNGGTVNGSSVGAEAGSVSTGGYFTNPPATAGQSFSATITVTTPCGSATSSASTVPRAGGATAPTSTTATSAAADGAGLDGLIFRLRGPMASNGGGTVFGCTMSEMTTSSHATPTAIRGSQGGWSMSTKSIPHLQSGTSAAVDFGPDGTTIVGASGDAVVEKAGNLLALQVRASENYSNCSLSKIGSSTAGDVYPVAWTACDAGCYTSPSVPPPHGTGCVAISAANGVLTLTAQLGTCTPSAFPAITASSRGTSPSTATPHATATKPKATRKPKKKLPLCKKRQRSTRAHPCRKK